ncbi:MAG: hypothetical protein LBQ68_05295 [Clostridiales bacterium]|jgi:hypothetical protein|nr:hypothetical protein [Clostridiales bacterium]
MKKRDIKKLNFIKNLNKEEYSLFYTYYRIEDVTELVRGLYLLPIKDTPIPVKFKGIDFILFNTKGVGVIVDFVCMQNKDNKFEVYEMSLKAYNEYERYMSK